MGEVGGSRSGNLGWLLVACAAATVTVACITLLTLGMRDVMDVGGRCASGNSPFEIRQECPDSAGAVVIGSFLGIVAAFVWAGAGHMLPAARRLALMAWPGLFLALAYNFFDYGFNPPEQFGDGTSWANVSLGVMFVIMGGGPLLALGSSHLRASIFGVPPASPPPDASGLSGVVRSSRVSLKVNGKAVDLDRSTAPPRTDLGVDLGGVGGTGITVGGMSLDQLIQKAVADGNVTTTGFTSVHVDDGSGRPPAVHSTGPTPAPATGSNLATDLAALADLHARGSLTDEQFEAAKTARIAQESAS